MICLGALGLIGMIVVISIFGFGAMFIPQSEVAAGTFGLGVIIGLIIAITHLPAFIAGWGLLKRKEWARILGIILAVINVLAFPFGTAIAIYAFWVLLNQETVRIFSLPAS